MPLPGHPIETARLTLRCFAPGDFDDLYAYQSRPDVARYLHWDARDRAQARQALERQYRETSLDADGDWLTFAVVWREAGRVIGEVGLRRLSREHHQGETGFVFNPDYHGRGLATEAAEAMLTLGFDGLGWHRIIGSCDARNHRSARLMERIGMRQEAHLLHNQIVKENGQTNSSTASSITSGKPESLPCDNPAWRPRLVGLAADMTRAHRSPCSGAA